MKSRARATRPRKPRPIIRNFRHHRPPAGLWRCSQCQFDSTDINEAAAHADKTSSWVWLFTPGSIFALFEMHYADWGGVYLDSAQSWRFTQQDLERQRAREITRRVLGIL